jgi:hypothetical protein
VTTLEALVAEEIENLAGVRPMVGGADRSWFLGDVEFAVLGPFGIELRLDPPIAAAAARTPDTAPSPRGPAWIRFNPRELDAHALDRLRAWLDLAYRRAAGG